MKKKQHHFKNNKYQELSIGFLFLLCCRLSTGLSTYIHRVNEPSVLGAASKSLLVFEEEKPVTMEDELAVFEGLIEK